MKTTSFVLLFMANLFIGTLPSFGQTATRPLLERNELLNQAEEMLNAITQPAFIETLRKFRATDRDGRLEFGKENLTPDALRSKGVVLPQHMRVSTRSFEEPQASSFSFVDAERSQRILSFLRTERPEMVQKLRIRNPDIFERLTVGSELDRPHGQFTALPGGTPAPTGSKGGKPGDSTAPAFALANSPLAKRPLVDPTKAWVCACGGAATVCAGAGGGKDSVVGSQTPFSNSTKGAMRETYGDLIDFATQPEFKVVVDQLYGLPTRERPSYVQNVLLNPAELHRRGVKIPKGILIQRSSFGDGRPTLFVVKKYLPIEHQVAWENVNLTFDQDHGANGAGILSGVNAWRKPLPYDVQAALQAMGLSPAEILELDKKSK